MSPQVNKKRCSQCELEKSLNEFCRDKNRRGGYRPECKLCASKWPRNRNPETVRQYEAKYRAGHLGQYRQSLVRWRKANPENIRERSRKWYAENREKALQRYAENREKVLQQQKLNPERRRQNRLKYEAKHPEKVALYRRQKNAKRRALKRQGAVGKVDYKLILRRDGYVCHICGQCVEPTDVHFDHIIPLARGGAHAMENIAVAHARCNILKGDSLDSTLLQGASTKP
ncbi:MAG: HNH endonuclease [Actinomycetales bacterium]|nr:HNH endonuclease [Actinomycetales bacterium]